MKLLGDDRNKPTSNEGSFQVRHGSRCFDPIYELQRRTRSVVGVSCMLLFIPAQVHRYLICISVRQMISRVFLVERGEPTADIYHFITSELNRRNFCDLREHRVHIMYGSVLFLSVNNFNSGD